ncbi:MAG: lysoplasmalogenase [Anaerolineaceae bacterium]
MQQTGSPFLMAIIGGLILLNWIGAACKNWKLYFVTKPLVLAGLISYFLLNGGLRSENLFFSAGLVLSLLGDIFLIPQSFRWFIAGLVSFFFAHVMYLVGFNRYTAPLLPTIICSSLAVALIAYLVRFILKQTRGKPELNSMRKLYIPYSIVLVLMTASAILCLFRPAWSKPAALLVSLGGLSFLASDILHACDRLGKRIPQAKLIIIVTYHLAQILFISGTLLNSNT